MDSLWVLTLLSIAMFFGCYIAGTIPLIMPMSEDRMEVVTVLGAGLLVGTALTVIIPEGVHTLFRHEHHGADESESNIGTAAEASAKHLNGGSAIHEEHSHSMEPHNVIGVSLLFGFILMLLIDQIAGGHHKPSDAETGLGRGRKVSFTATLGLVVHAAADGIALGAAAASSHTDVEMIVFFAIMLHKAPAAFGLVTFLLHEGLEKTRVKKHLMTFALAAPVGAFLTYFLITQSGSETMSSSRSTGIAMLFSAGTFLYVSTVHVLPELTSHSHGDGGGGGKTFSKKQLGALIGGSVLPLFLSLGHHH